MSEDRIGFKVEKVRLQRDPRNGDCFVVIDIEPACSFSIKMSRKDFVKRKKFVETYYPNQVVE